MEVTEHNRALYLTVKCEDSVVTRVLVDNVSSANICPLSTLNKLKEDDERIPRTIEKPGRELFFDGAANMKGVGIGAVLVSGTGHHYPIVAQLRFYCTNNMDEYEACILGLRMVVDMGFHEVLVLGNSDLLVHQIQGEWETRDLKCILY
ncbi:uncharacterized protein [Nicotiana sylvestris]|uniref:uncharacterized protein n=1 Tax=Nicotiana sylvestris TaxID=4096 RepID=UPI00388CE6D2